uniref:Uncharacterized protein n=1 Tax=uncultured marine virus TaxID=186617 RepID=A0A0F7L8X4_9VIRU|nr:hypothetical protein [uncultured marine virus]
MIEASREMRRSIISSHVISSANMQPGIPSKNARSVVNCSNKTDLPALDGATMTVVWAFGMPRATARSARDRIGRNLSGLDLAENCGRMRSMVSLAHSAVEDSGAESTRRPCIHADASSGSPPPRMRALRASACMSV